MIEIYHDTTVGYHPFLIRKNWQVAQLNYLPLHGFDDIPQIEVHKQTDEVFILMEGTGVLIAADVKEEAITFELINMQKGVTYNIPAGRWHNIAMTKDAQMIIVENANTHLHDCILMDLTAPQKEELYRKITEALSK